MDPKETNYCYYSDLPSPMAYMQMDEEPMETKEEESLHDLPVSSEEKNEHILSRSEPNTHG